MLLRAYNPNVTFRNFPALDQQLEQYYDRIYHTVIDYHVSPRFFFETGLKITFRDVFYYLDMLYDNDPESIIDVGCAECVWKRWFPRITGFDPNSNPFSAQDFVDYFDRDFSQGHQRHYDCGMTINSLHFISWRDFLQQIDLAMNIVRDRFLFTFNFDSMDHVPDLDLHELIQDTYYRLQHSGYELVMFDSPVHRGITETEIGNFAFFNGTVRFILQHPNT